MAKKEEEDFEISGRTGRTADVELSDRSEWLRGTDPSAKVVGDRSCLAGGHLKGCLKVKTQYESLAWIGSQLVLSSFEIVAKTAKPKVRFSSVELQPYDRVLTDNPSTSSGPPIGIGGAYHPEDALMFDVDLYEREREGYRRTGEELQMPPHVRVDMLREAGYSRSELKSAAERSRKDKARIHASLKLRRLEPILEMLESVRLGSKRDSPQR